MLWLIINDLVICKKAECYYITNSVRSTVKARKIYMNGQGGAEIGRVEEKVDKRLVSMYVDLQKKWQ